MMKLSKRLFSLALSITLLCLLAGLSLPAHAANDFTVEGPADSYAYEGGVLTIANDGSFSVTQADSSTATTDKIVVAAGVKAEITISGLNIDASNPDTGDCAFELKSGAEVELILEDDNILKSSIHRAGLEVPEGAALTIGVPIGANDDYGKLTASSNGNGAGIGGKGGHNTNGGDCGSITINSGTVTASSRSSNTGYGAGIGGGGAQGSDCSGGSGGTITINGGKVTAYAGSGSGSGYGAGIGGGSGGAIGDGSGGNGGIITINGGEVIAYSSSGNTGYGAGIGGGNGSGSGSGDGGTITINGGKVTAYSSSSDIGYGAGIGGGGSSLSNGGGGGEITIKGGEVTAYSSSRNIGYGAGIGGGAGGSGTAGAGGTITISDGKVVACSGGGGAGYGAGIGGGGGTKGSGTAGAGGSVKISGGDVQACSSNSSSDLSYGAGIGGGGAVAGGTAGAGGSVEISGGMVLAYSNLLSSSSNASDIGGGGVVDGGGTTGADAAVKITGGSVHINTSINHAVVKAWPTNGSVPVYPVKISLGTGEAKASVTAVGGLGSYGLEDVKTDSLGNLYFWLPVNSGYTITVTTDGGSFRNPTPVAVTGDSIPDFHLIKFAPDITADVTGRASGKTITATEIKIGGYIIEYAVSKSDSTAPTEGWQTGLSFGNLSGGRYYLWARVQAGSGFDAGTAKASAAIRVGSTDDSDRETGTTKPVDPDATILINGKPVEAGKITVDLKNGETILALDPEALRELITGGTDEILVIIPLDEDTPTAVASLPAEILELLAESGATITIQVGDVQYSLPADAINLTPLLNQLGANDSSEVTLDIRITPVADDASQRLVSQALRGTDASLVLPAMQFEIIARLGDKSVSVNRFPSFVTRTVVLTAEQAAQATTVVAIDANGKIRHVPTRLYQSSGSHYVDFNSLTNSLYALISSELSFSDAEGKWFESAVNEMGSRQIIAGVGEGLFAGERDITRAEFAAIIVRALGLPSDGDGSVFADVSTGAWYCGAVGTALEYGIVSGIDEDNFAPDRQITRQEAMLIIQRAAKIAGFAGSSGSLEDFADSGEVSGWAQDAASWNVGSGLIVGSGGQLRPQDNISRAETATLVLKLLRQAGLIDVRS